MLCCGVMLQCVKHLIYIKTGPFQPVTMAAMIHNFRAPRTSIMAANPLVDRLIRLPLFAGLDPGALARVTAGAEEVSLPSGTVIYRQGDPCKGLYIVVVGQVKLALQASHGAEKVVELVGPGGCFGEATITRGCPHVLTAETIVDTRLIHLAKAAAQEELVRTPVFARSIISSLSDRMHHLIAAFEDCMLHSGTERVIGYLVNRLPKDADHGDGTITLTVKKGIIASQLNLTQEHFSRILRELTSKGLIEVSGRSVRVPDIAQLRAHTASAVGKPLPFESPAFAAR
jgi:CRP-like cAMP-binding protein